MRYLRLIAALIVVATIAGCAGQAGRTSDDYGAFRGRWWNYYDRGVWHLANQRYAEAKDDFDRALAGRTRDAWSARTYGLHFQEFFPNREMGIALYHEGDLDGAEAFLTQSTEQVDSARAWYYLDRIKRDKIAQGIISDDAAPSISSAEFGGNVLLRDLDVPVSLTVADDNGVTDVTVLGERLYQRKSETEKTFETQIRLEEGEHPVPVELADLADKTTSEQYTVTIDTTSPSIAYIGYVPGVVTQESSYTLRGVAMDDHGVTSVRLDDEAFQGPGGEMKYPFELNLPLSAGENTFKLAVSDAAGNDNVVAIQIFQGDRNTAAAKLWWLEQRAPERLKVAMVGGPAFLAAVLDTAYAQAAVPVSIEVEFPEVPSDRSPYKRNIIPIKGKVVAPGGVAAVQVDNRDVVPEDTPEGATTIEFQRRVGLEVGENDINVVAQDAAGERAENPLIIEAQYPLLNDPETFMPIAVSGAVVQDESGSLELNPTLVVNLEAELQNRFFVVDREQIDAVLLEQQISAEELASVDTRIPLGNIVASQFILTGRLLRYKDSADQFIVRLTNTESTEVTIFDSVIENIDDVNSVKRGMKDVFEQLVDHFPRVNGTVRGVRGEQVLADYTADIGVKENSYFLFLKVVQEAWVDDATGEVLDPAVYGVGGRARIDSVQASTRGTILQIDEDFEVAADTPTITW